MATGEILWIMPKWPLPVEDGARVATRALVRNLPGLGVKLDLLALAGSDEACDEASLRREFGFSGQIHVLRRAGVGRGTERQIRNLARLITKPNLPVTVARYASGALKTGFQGLLATEAYTRLVFDGLHGAALLSAGGEFAKSGGLRMLYRAHNVETRLWQRAADQAPNPVERKLLERQHRLMLRFETSMLAQADLVAAVSAEDIRVFREMVPGGNYIHTPIGLDFGGAVPPPPTLKDGKLKLLYLGRLDWPPNRDGLKWFLDKVWRRAAERRPDLALVIAGSGDDAWLKGYRGLERVEFLGRVENVKPLYHDCAAAIVPVFYGSGTRLKVIEPARFKRAVISTGMGVEGSFLTEAEYLRADSEDDWLGTLATLDLDTLTQLGEKARAKLEPLLDEQRIAAAFANKLGMNPATG